MTRDHRAADASLRVRRVEALEVIRSGQLCRLVDDQGGAGQEVREDLVDHRRLSDERDDLLPETMPNDYCSGYWNLSL